MINTDEIRELIDAHHEWLLVRDAGKSFPLIRTEIEITPGDDKTLFGFLDEGGFHRWRLNDFELENGEIALDVAGAFARKRETMRLVPRSSSAVLAAEIEIARLKKANELAALIAENFPGTEIVRVALNAESGRLTQIIFQNRSKTQIAAIADVSETLVPEAILTSAMLWLEKLGLRARNPINDIRIVSERRQSKNLQKLHALLADRWKNKITIVDVSRKKDPPRVTELPKRKIRELWRERSKNLELQENAKPTETAKKVVELSPEKIDIVYSKHGETARFLGLPFTRVRTMLGVEKAWFGIDKNRRILTPENWNELAALVNQLETYRTAASENIRHEFYRTAPEAWLESIFRRNIKLLDANLILSPIYNQFRASNDKIDLLALRKDGRLVIVELKTQPDREMIFQAADYWRKIELQRRCGLLSEANLFDGREILNEPALIYLVAPALSFHRDFEFFARTLSSDIELWRFELHENWRENIRVLARRNYAEPSAVFTNL